MHSYAIPAQIDFLLLSENLLPIHHHEITFPLLLFLSSIGQPSYRLVLLAEPTRNRSFPLL